MQQILGGIIVLACALFFAQPYVDQARSEKPVEQSKLFNEIRKQRGAGDE